MDAWKKICCPVDFSAVSAFALEEAARQARSAGGTLTLLHVREDHLPSSADDTLASHEALEQAAVEDERLLTAWEERARRMAHVPVEAVIVSGDPVSEILRHATRRRYDVLVMGTHGRTGRQDVPFGSVAQRVVLDAPCPVLVVHAHASTVGDRSAAQVA